MNVKKAVTPVLVVFLSLFFLTQNALASSEVEDECRAYAKEEQVPVEELSEFIQSCITYQQSQEQEQEQEQEQDPNSSNEVIKEDLR